MYHLVILQCNITVLQALLLLTTDLCMCMYVLAL